MEPKKIASLVIAIISVVNIVLDALGLPLLHLDDNTIYTAVSAVVLVAAWVSNIWFNFNFTDASKAGQKLTDRIKSGDLDVDRIIESLDKICDAVGCSESDPDEETEGE